MADARGGILAGVKVLELSQLIAAPLCGLTLLDYGAEVIKVEPAGGEYTRTLVPFLPGGDSAYFHMLNRGKRGIAVDFRADGARALLSRLIDGADVVIESLGGAAAALEGYESASARNPKLVWCSITGMGRGQGGRAIDPTLQASMGMMALTGEPDRAPMRLPVPLVDFSTGLYAVQGILAALLAVQRTGRGTLLDCAMLDTAATLSASVGVYALNGPEPLRRMGTENYWFAPAATFQGSDGAWVHLIAISEPHWRATCRGLGRPEWIERFPSNQARVAARAQLHGMVADVVATAPAQQWADAITAAGGFCHRIREIEEAWGDPALAARGLRADIAGLDGWAFPVPVASLARIDSGPGRVLPPGPGLGEHSRAVAAEAGLGDAEIDALFAAGALI